MNSNEFFLPVHEVIDFAIVLCMYTYDFEYVSLRVLKVIMATEGKKERKGIQVCLALQGSLGEQALW